MAVVVKWGFYSQYVNVVNGLASSFRLVFEISEAEVQLPAGDPIPVDPDPDTGLLEPIRVDAALVTTPGPGAFYTTMAVLFLIGTANALVWVWVTRPNYATFRRSEAESDLTDKLLPGERCCHLVAQ